MDLLIPHSWLKKYLDTKGTPKEIAKYLSLCGPSIEKVEASPDGDYIYSIEITTNRVDTASVLGIAREACAILPRFGISAKIKPSKSQGLNKLSHQRFKFVKKVGYLDVIVAPKLCPRFTAVLIKGVTVKDSPKEIQELLSKIGLRPINNIVDVSNYIMHELGQPVHTFDYDRIAGHKMILRESKKGEELITLDKKKFKLPGGDIVIEDGGKKLIDLCGIMGGENSAIDQNTKNVLLFVQNYDKHKIRKTSMTLSQRSEAAVLFEKGLDSETVKPAILSAIDLIEKLSQGVAVNQIIDIYEKPYKQRFITTTLAKQEEIIGIKLIKKDITNYLTSLGFTVTWNSDELKVEVPSFRTDDINIPEDIAEEIARIYGYHNLPNILMPGDLPKPRHVPILNFEKEIKLILKAFGAVEIFNLSLTDKSRVDKNSLKLRNAMGGDTEYLRTSLMPLLVDDINNNSATKGKIHLFELSNIYIPTQNKLPTEVSTLAGIIREGDYRENKGIVEALLENLTIVYSQKTADGNNYLPNQKIEVYSEKEKIGEYGNLENGHFYYEFEIQKLMNAKKFINKYEDPPKYPPQIEDLTFEFPFRTQIGEAISYIKSINQLIRSVELKDVFNNSYTFTIKYQNPNKTLTDKEVETIRTEILSKVKNKLGGQIKTE